VATRYCLFFSFPPDSSCFFPTSFSFLGLGNWILQFTKNDCFLSIFCSVFFTLVFVFVNVFYSSWQASRRGHGFPSALALMPRWIFLVHCCCCFWHGRRRQTCECGVEHCRCSINLSWFCFCGSWPCFLKKIRQPAVFFFIDLCISGLKCGSSSRQMGVWTLLYKR